MKASLLALSLLSVVLQPALALPSDDTQTPQQGTPDEPQGEQPANDETYTTFNGVQVPAMKEIEGHKFDEEIKEGYWYGARNHIASNIRTPLMYAFTDMGHGIGLSSITRHIVNAAFR